MRDREVVRKDRPRTGPLPWLLGVGGGLLVLACAAVAILLLVRAPEDGAGGPAPAQRVTAADLAKVEIFMTRHQVEGALGKGQPADAREIHPNWVRAGRQVGATEWYRWGGGDDAVYVGFGRGGSGTPRAVVSLFVHRYQRGGGAGEEVTLGFLNLDPPGTDLDVLGRDRGKESALLKDPKWKKGPEVRKALVGFWVAVGVGGYDFKADGTFRSQSGGDRGGGTYRFTDDEHVELTLQADPVFAGQ